MRIHPVDLGIVLLYLAGVTLLGAWFRRGQKDVRDYFLGGKTAPAWALACSIVATETSTLTIIGTPAIAFAGNLGFLQLVMGYLVARVVLCVVFVPRYFQGEFYTAYQLLEKRFGRQGQVGGGRGFSGDAGAGRGRADRGGGQSGERGAGDREPDGDLDCDIADACSTRSRAD